MDKNNNSKLNNADKRIIAAIETDARTSIAELAKRAKVSRTVAEYRLRKLEDGGVVRGYYCLLDPSRFGYTVWKLWISIRAGAEEKHNFFQYVEKHPRIWWYAECAGVYDAVLCVLARTPHEFNKFFNHLQDRFGKGITDSAILINVSFEYHTRGYLLNKHSHLIRSSFQEDAKARSINPNTLGILQHLSLNSRMSLVELHMKTGKNVKTIKNAISELKSSGVIVYFRPSVDTTKLGVDFYKVLIYIHNSIGGIIPSIASWCRAQKNITAIIFCVGPWQLELEVEIDTFRNLSMMLKELKDKFPDVVKHHETLLVTKEGNFELDLINRLKRIEKET
ncbi:Lrp/AsnC family transcriptional regulator [Candidatus Woesearchaeota archaeon]|nr:Lrp/AsnC family transcriptional regulator [Candidatus Woesearchaeota archaeon]